MKISKLRIFNHIFLTLFFVSVQAQSPKINSLIIEAIYPSFHYLTINGEHISSTPISGEFNPGWNTCRPCSVGTEIPLSVNRTSNDFFGPIRINGSTNLVISGVSYTFATGWLEMKYNVSPAKLIKGDQRRTPKFARESTALMRLKLWRNDNEFPNAASILDQTMEMKCTAYLSLNRYRNASGTSWLFDTKSYKWVCTTIN